MLIISMNANLLMNQGAICHKTVLITSLHHLFAFRPQPRVPKRITSYQEPCQRSEGLGAPFTIRVQLKENGPTRIPPQSVGQNSARPRPREGEQSGSLLQRSPEPTCRARR